MSAIKNIARFTKRFAEMTATGNKAADLIHAVGVEVLEHFKLHQDISLVNAYFMALPKGNNFKAVAQWLLKYTAVRLNTADNKKDEPFKFAKGKPHEVEQATVNPFWTMQNAAVPNVGAIFDVKAKMLDLVKRAAKAEKLEGDFQALRKAALAMGISEADLPLTTDAALAVATAVTGKATAKTTKANKEPSKGTTKAAQAIEADPLETVTE